MIISAATAGAVYSGSLLTASLPAGLIATALLLPASPMARAALALLGDGKLGGFVGRLALAGLLLFAFLCARGVEVLSQLQNRAGLRGGDSPEDRAWTEDLFLTLSLGHAVLVGVGLLALVALILRTAQRGSSEGRRFAAAAAATLYLHLVSVLWLGLLVSFYVL